MPGDNPSATARDFIEAIEEAEQRTEKYAAFIKKLQSRLSQAKKVLATKPAVASQVTKLVSDLRALPAEPEKISTSQLIQALGDRLQQLQKWRRESFSAELRQACKSSQLDFASHADGFAVGPFSAVPDWSTETACFQYAKIVVLNDVALNPKAIVEGAISLKATLLDAPIDFKKFGDWLHEAMRVALARQSKTGRTEQPKVLGSGRLVCNTC